MRVLVTGGAGYIGSHTSIELLNQGHEVVIVDDFSNSNKIAVDRIESISGKKVTLYNFNILDLVQLSAVFDQEKIDAVIHFAAFKAVGESVSKPIEYYTNNISGLIGLLNVMRDHNVKNIIFSSSATVYGSPKSNPIREDFELSTTNPYGATKLMTEDILKDVAKADPEWNVVILRYFNPVGAHESGLIGEDPAGIPNNLVPYITQVAVGKLEKLAVFGDDYDTVDGTGVRDYIHVVDLALGHVAALKKIAEIAGYVVYNLGTGVGYSVLEMVKAFSDVSGVEIPYEIKERRPGDIATCFADPEKARTELGWEAKFDLKKMSEDSWRWQSQNPNGYKK
ncbi:UDP-glucose 4-epimerase GalE [Erysipelothrix sp. HDW6C]|uniref:UDP-glucose 4-epimerase GalE n=1 Tax=Erysipelothrix sp. HDW6C TaxID=2714930 RepID=UPI00140B0490|nr:UDP-glucose 4-epimerase GalE [Erysipelothrix sp. HDW6C]QIK70111.1 UDP-glucose 4-epimerase GalE [Erysipelothrix sp. HDW6C]